jgi:hypothetical protein
MVADFSSEVGVGTTLDHGVGIGGGAGEPRPLQVL